MALLITDEERKKRGLALVEKYVTMGHPQGPMEKMAGLPPSRPEYQPTSGGIARSSDIMMDAKIVSVAACLRGGAVNLRDGQAVASAAMKAITHYERRWSCPRAP